MVLEPKKALNKHFTNFGSQYRELGEFYATPFPDLEDLKLGNVRSGRWRRDKFMPWEQQHCLLVLQLCLVHNVFPPMGKIPSMIHYF